MQESMLLSKTGPPFGWPNGHPKSPSLSLGYRGRDYGGRDCGGRKPAGVEVAPGFAVGGLGLTSTDTIGMKLQLSDKVLSCDT